jgi:hypothetical protein
MEYSIWTLLGLFYLISGILAMTLFLVRCMNGDKHYKRVYDNLGVFGIILISPLWLIFVIFALAAEALFYGYILVYNIIFHNTCDFNELW